MKESNYKFSKSSISINLHFYKFKSILFNKMFVESDEEYYDEIVEKRTD